jgi:hypothetical protein
VVYLSPGKIAGYFVNNVMTAFFQIVSCPSFANRPSSHALLLNILTSCDKSQKIMYCDGEAEQAHNNLQDCWSSCWYPYCGPLKTKQERCLNSLYTRTSKLSCSLHPIQLTVNCCSLWGAQTHSDCKHFRKQSRLKGSRLNGVENHFVRGTQNFCRSVFDLSSKRAGC